MEKKKNRSLKWKAIHVMLMYWVLPFLVIIVTIGSYSLMEQEKNQMERIVTQAELNTRTCAERLGTAIADSRQVTYDRVLYEWYREGKRAGAGGESTFSSRASTYLDTQYSHNRNQIFTVLMLKEDPVNKRYTTYNFQTGGSYQMIRDFFLRDCEMALERAESLDTAVAFVTSGDRLYLVRNLMDRSFQPWGVLVNCLNPDYCFETLTAAWEDFQIKVRLNGQSILTRGEGDWGPEGSFSPGGGYRFFKDQIYVSWSVKENDFTLEFLLKTNQKTLFTPLYGFFYVVLSMVFLLVPMCLIFLRLFQKYLSRPVGKMMACAEEIEGGNLGIQMEEETGSLELEYLRETMNQMSRQLKYQFDHIYEEELALRDARIMALQSHINPHFMNNTLEIINWEARLSGNEKVSAMIQALSTLLDAAIDRKGLPEVRLSEEMVYVNAYFYITSQRLGKRLKVEISIPPELMELKVPRLILQPIIENAIEHGIVPRGSGTVAIQGCRRGDLLQLQVINDGEFTRENEEKVERLLDPSYDARKESAGNLGIANVNQRLRILYGEGCGLTIKRCQDGRTASTLTILVRE
ncbi:MAG: sensor histidine kinase [Eubacteriales bacterium]|nr:sensor histidine kinase [Eubacteriales bacterium]